MNRTTSSFTVNTFTHLEDRPDQYDKKLEVLVTIDHSSGMLTVTRLDGLAGTVIFDLKSLKEEDLLLGARVPLNVRFWGDENSNPKINIGAQSSEEGFLHLDPYVEDGQWGVRIPQMTSWEPDWDLPAPGQLAWDLELRKEDPAEELCKCVVDIDFEKNELTIELLGVTRKLRPSGRNFTGDLEGSELVFGSHRMEVVGREDEFGKNVLVRLGERERFRLLASDGNFCVNHLCGEGEEFTFV